VSSSRRVSSAESELGRQVLAFVKKAKPDADTVILSDELITKSLLCLGTTAKEESVRLQALKTLVSWRKGESPTPEIQVSVNDEPAKGSLEAELDKIREGE
jgi:hypothetical protein